ncbi:patatin-like phospholipase family protein [Porticoccus sp. W117]|uniref:patatin-like phospholipase family protein n=1 Tax=Porticoccus sp. W117 TaxID=3054777 RepID=UPI002595942D|nr:patatin-like phospholipase family protein [Porticoccus sp. W117]MDM3870551.1 patatin-like phospholipase family protein [Porticoccus sp. W117]
MAKTGIALGGGGVRGLAHILALETLDKCGIKPAAIAGASMGAIIGALYASGLSGEDIHAGVNRHIIRKGDDLKNILAKKTDLLKWLKLATPTLRRGGFLNADGALHYLLDLIEVRTFEELKIPLTVVATDYWSGEVVEFRSGELLPALKASMAIPGVFPPVEIDGRVLVDGGIANNLPYDLLPPECDCTVAVDVAPTRVPQEKEAVPGLLDAVLGTFDILLENADRQRLAKSPPSVYLKPKIVGVRTLDFDMIEEVFEQAAPAMAEFEDKLQQL